MIQKQTVYLPVKVEDELPLESCKCGIIKNKEFDLSYFIKAPSYNVFDHVKSGLYHKQTEITHWLKPQEGYFFTSKQLNEYTANVIRQALETAAEKAYALIKDHDLYIREYVGTEYSVDIDMSEDSPLQYGCSVITDKESIINTFEEIFKFFKI